VTFKDAGGRWSRRRVQDWIALLCLIGGAVLLLGVGFAWQPLAGFAVLGALLVSVGVYAGLE
jgi:hypothetical protein